LSSLSGSFASKQNNAINQFYSSPISTLFQKDKHKADKLSPRLKDLTIQKSAYNEIIPVIYGKNRLAGNIIWATDIREVETVNTTSSGGGKGSPKVYQTTKTYHYYANVAIAICQGEASELNRVWADTELLDLSKYNYRFYKGSETQNPDSLIESIKGVGLTPAYRGLCYIVFQDFPLAEFGNRIPNFTFEITRGLEVSGFGEEKVESLITGVNVIPGCGEFVYDTTVHYKKEGAVIDGVWVEYGKKTRINQNNNSNKADSLVSLDNLRDTLPNCGWIAPVVTWFGDTLDASTCTIKPRVEYGNDSEGYPIYTSPSEWTVGSWTRFNTPIVSKDNGALRYGGTISDGSIVRYLQEAKNRGLKIMFYPMFFMDIANKPWRGRLTGNSTDVNSFFTKINGYNEFILHYANLVKDYVDAFVIGSEMIGLTKLQASDNSFPAVDNLISLASSVKTIVGINVKVSYAGDWSEYHHTEGGWYNMDKLWSSSNIDFIGIDAYFPLTDSIQKSITKQNIIDGWESGEGYDWYYTDAERTTKTNLEAKFAWKNIDWWWKNVHINPDSNQTTWVPESKKIWFTEYGFASIDGTSNEPNKFYDPASLDGGIPRFSEGRVDNFAQRQALLATEEKWKNSTMIEQKFVWCWDARPYPFYPNNLAIWSDGSLYKYGHWLNGKLGGTLVSQLILGILTQGGIASNIIGDISIYDDVEGVAINNKITVINLLDILRKVYFFDCIESEGEIKFLTKNSNSIANISENELVQLKKDNDREVYIEVNIIGEDELPKKLDLSFINKDFNYQTGTTFAERNSIKNDIVDIENVPVVLSEYKARQVAEINLYLMWLERVIYTFILPIQYLYLEPTDIITLTYNNSDLKLQITSLSLTKNNTLEIKAVRCNNSIYDTNITSEQGGENNITTLPIGDTDFKIFELPALSSANINNPMVYFTTNGQESGWKGCILYNSKNGGGSFDVIDEAKNNSIVGACCNILGSANPYYFDNINELTVYFDDRIIVDIDNAENADLFTGSNMALVGDEILQFKTVELQQDGSY
ncbi:MAG: glycoside hydrolase TIM-barrel-like domain-containing protein, partial [Firmicutes bacterium]|nr:glycoside hydrolase TIM-barrel-like domain-containing protein [Bacillota bacterium]